MTEEQRYRYWLAVHALADSEESAPPSTPRLLSMATLPRVGQSAACAICIPIIYRLISGATDSLMYSKMVTDS